MLKGVIVKHGQESFNQRPGKTAGRKFPVRFLKPAKVLDPLQPALIQLRINGYVGEIGVSFPEEANGFFPQFIGNRLKQHVI